MHGKWDDEVNRKAVCCTFHMILLFLVKWDVVNCGHGEATIYILVAKCALTELKTRKRVKQNKCNKGIIKIYKILSSIEYMVLN